MTISDIQNEIIKEFGFFEDKNQIYDYLIDLGKEHPKLSTEHKIDKNIIKGCQSKVWISTNYKNGKVLFLGDSDSILVRGLVNLILRTFSGHSPEEIIQAPIYFIDRIGLKSMLSMNRANGLNAMLKQIKLFALAISNKNKIS